MLQKGHFVALFLANVCFLNSIGKSFLIETKDEEDKQGGTDDLGD